MSEKDNNKKRRPLKSLPPDGFPLKTGLIWVAIIGVPPAGPKHLASVSEITILFIHLNCQVFSKDVV